MSKTKLVEINITEESRADLAVQAVIKQSRSRLRGMFEHQCVRVNAMLITDPAYRVQVGDILTVTWDPERKYREKSGNSRLNAKGSRAPSRYFEVIFEDEDLIVVQKSSGILTVPLNDEIGIDREARERRSRSLVDEIRGYLRFTAGKFYRGPWVVHRLDRDTSGLLVFGKSPAVAENLIAQFAEKKPRRVYTAIVAGLLANHQGTFQSNLYTDQFLNQKSTNRADIGKTAITHFTVVERLRDATVVSVVLETGRRNQIRVHFADQGHPVIGDARYKTQIAQRDDWPHRRLALHAGILGFKHPTSGKYLECESPLPKEFLAYIKAHRKS